MWVVVDKDGTECVCAIKPNRACYAPTWEGIDPDDGDYRDCIAMPTGSIERLLGRKLTWEDEPVEITNLTEYKNNTTMEKKEIKITVPEGYEIDKENSTFECIKFKKKSTLSYRQMLTKLAERGDTYLYINEFGDVMRSNRWAYLDILFTIFDERQAKQLFALNKLMNVAAYLNEKTLDWNDDDQTRWYIYYDHKEGALGMSSNGALQSSNVYFDSDEHAEQAIEILGEDTIKKALGVLE